MENDGETVSAPSQALNRADLQRFVDKQRLEAVILPLEEHTATVADAARVLGVRSEQIIKSLVFLVEGEPLLLVNNGETKVDRRKLAARLSVGRKRIKFATPDQALSVTGYVVGSMPPFGHLQKLKTFVDPAVVDQAVVFGGGGDIDAMMRLDPQELLRVTGAEVLDISVA